MTEVEVSILKQNVRSFVNNFNKNDIIDYQTLLIYIYKLYQIEENKIIQEIINNLFTKYPEWFKENLLGRNFPITAPEHYQKLLININLELDNFGTISPTIFKILLNTLIKIEESYFKVSIFKPDTLLNENYLKEYFIRKEKIPYECKICGLIEWQNEPLPLSIDYIDKNPHNQNIENIRFLCPNCFSQVGWK